MKRKLTTRLSLAFIFCVWVTIAHAQSSLEEDSVFHFAGYSDIGYKLLQGGGEDVFSAKLAPIVHYQYQDWFFIEAEGEFDFEDAGTSEKSAGLEYASINFFLNDNLSIGVGKYLSPVGQFIQNQHPSWINKLPVAPLGFAGGHGGSAATPNTEFGIQARGGIETGENSRMNYALMVGNGPELIVEENGGGTLIIEGLDFPAKIDDANSDKSIAGRLGFLPVPNFEMGISFETADAAFSSIKADDEEGDHGEEGGEEEDGHSGSLIRDRSYQVFSFDFYFAPTKVKNLILRGEFASTELGQGRADEYDRSKKRWEAWYTQASYFFPDQKIETVVRYGNFSPAGGKKGEQLSFGLNYVHKSNSIFKAAYEFNNSGRSDRVLFQYAYGF